MGFFFFLNKNYTMYHKNINYNKILFLNAYSHSTVAGGLEVIS